MNNAITPFNDALEDYIKCCIANEEKGNGETVVIKGFEDMLEAYNREKETTEKLSKETCGKSDLTIDQTDGKIKQLFNLKYCGPVIKHHMDLEAHAKAALEIDVPIGMINAFFQQLFSNFKFWWRAVENRSN